MYTIVNNIELRPDCNILISRCDASDFLQESKPTLESVSARYYELILNSSDYTGYSENITLKNFYSDLLSSSCQAHAILGGINSSGTHDANYNLPLYDMEGSYKANETPIETPSGIENMGIAVFAGDKLIGELNGTETLCHLLITNSLNSSIITIPSPFSEDKVISLYITTDKKAKNTVDFINSTPFIKSDISINASILSMDEDLDYSSEENLKAIEQYCSTYLEQNTLSCLYKTSKEFKSDIFDFGSLAMKNYLTWDDWTKSDWLTNYENAFFKVTIHSNIQSGQLFTKI